MKTLPNVLPRFREVIAASSDNMSLEFKTDCAYLLDERDELSTFIDRIGKQRGHELDLYNFYAAYNIEFPTIPATISLISNRRSVALNLRNFDELLRKICEHSDGNSTLAVFLAIQDRPPEVMLRLKREILQQFVYLRIYMPIIIDENFHAALKTLDKIVGSTSDEQTEITFLGTKKSGKSSLINAVLGAEYSPAGSELPTPNKVTYSRGGGNIIRLESEGQTRTFDNPDALKNHLANEFRRASKTASALSPMHVFIPDFPEDLRDFDIVDTPGPNFASSTEHSQVVKGLLKRMQNCVFVMNYSAHLTNDEVSLFDSAYRVFNNKRRHRTMIVAVNRIDEMYAAEVIKSYERFADYVRRRLNALGYDNIVVVSVSALTAVYTNKIRQLMSEVEEAPLEKQLRALRKKYKGTEQATVVSFVEKALNDILDFHGVEIETLEALNRTSRVSYLMRMAESMYDPAEQFEWIDETFADVLDEEFDSDEEFFERALEYANQGNPDAMVYVGMMYRYGNGVGEDLRKSIEWHEKAAALGNTDAKIIMANCYRHGDGVGKNMSKAIELYNSAIDDGSTDAMCQLAWLYRLGSEVEEDSPRAFKLFLRAANAGDDEAFAWNLRAAELDNVTAMINTAYCYTYGEGVVKNVPKAIEWLNRANDACDGKNADALFELAKIYHEGDGVAQDKRKAFELMKASAELGDVKAMTNTAYCYRYGDGVEKNLGKAVEWYNKAIEASDGNDATALYVLSIMYDDGEGVAKDERRSFELCKKAAELGYERAYESLAVKYHLGSGVGIDLRRAFEWHKKAAELGNVEAMSLLGLMYENGEYVSEDHRESTRWYRKAAEQGDTFSMNNLAYNYAQGRGVGKSFSDAVYWYERAIENGDESCVAALGWLYYENEYYAKALKYFKQTAEVNDDYALMNRIGNMYWSGEGTSVDYDRAVYWYRKSAEGGFAWAKYNLGDCYRQGRGVAKDLSVAIRWYSAAADDGIDDALEALGHAYYSRETKNGYQNALYWYKRAAEKGNAGCMNRVGVMYNDGVGVAQDYDEAMRWYKRAAELGNAMAMRNIGTLYRYGSGVSRNFAIAVDWLKKSLAAGNEEARKEINETLDEQLQWNAERERERNRSSGGGCFITTAVCRSLGKGDDCRELETFRAYRDGWLSAQPEGRSLIEQYYRTAPSIVERIDEREDSARIYDWIWSEYLSPCYLMLERGENDLCERRYVEMVERLSVMFAPKH